MTPRADEHELNNDGRKKTWTCGLADVCRRIWHKEIEEAAIELSCGTKHRDRGGALWTLPSIQNDGRGNAGETGNWEKLGTGDCG